MSLEQKLSYLWGSRKEKTTAFRLQSINCSVCISCLPQFRIKKSNIFGVED